MKRTQKKKKRMGGDEKHRRQKEADQEMGDADYTGNQLTLDGQRTGGFVDYWHLVGGGPLFFFSGFFYFDQGLDLFVLFLVLLRVFIFLMISMDSNRKIP